MIDLNQRQREDLTEQFVELVVDNMSEKDLVRYAQEQLIDSLNQYSLEELKDDVDQIIVKYNKLEGTETKMVIGATSHWPILDNTIYGDENTIIIRL